MANGILSARRGKRGVASVRLNTSICIPHTPQYLGQATRVNIVGRSTRAGGQRQFLILRKVSIGGLTTSDPCGRDGMLRIRAALCSAVAGR